MHSMDVQFVSGKATIIFGVLVHGGMETHK